MGTKGYTIWSDKVSRYVWKKENIQNIYRESENNADARIILVLFIGRRFDICHRSWQILQNQ